MDHKTDHMGHKDVLIGMLIQCEEAGTFSATWINQARRLLAVDLGQARQLILEMRARLNRCRHCRHGRRPGLAEGYCLIRVDLPIVYGHLRALPPDRGAWCEQYEETGQ